MKQIAFTLFLMASLLCQGQSVETEKGKKTATVIVEIPNAENYDLVLSVQGENFEDKITQKIKKGRATFKVPYSHSDVAFVEWQHNLDNHQGNRTFIHVLLEEETILVQSKWESESMQVSETDYKPFYLFEDVVFKKSKMNQTRYEAAYKLFALNRVKGWINHTMLDSLSKFFFPQQRKDAIQLFESEFYKLAPRIQAEMFNTMLSLMAFEPEYVSEDDRKAVNRIYSGFSNTNPAWDYRFKILEYKLWNINYGGLIIMVKKKS
jgi:hypothetical protein